MSIRLEDEIPFVVALGAERAKLFAFGFCCDAPSYISGRISISSKSKWKR